MAGSGRARAYWFAFAAIVTLQVGNALALSLIHHVGVPTAAFLRFSIGSLVLVAVLKPTFRLRRPELRLVLLFGLFLACMGGLIYAAVDRLPLSVAITISLLGPLTVAAVRSRRRLDLIWPLVALFGVVLMAKSDGGSGASIDPLGLLFAAGNAVAWGGYIIISSRAGDHFEGIEGLALASVVAAVLWMPAGIAGGGFSDLTLAILLLACVTAVLATALPYSLENLALRSMPQRVFGTLASFEPVVAILVGLVIGQQPGPLALTGIALVILASVGASLPLAPKPASTR